MLVSIVCLYKKNVEKVGNKKLHLTLEVIKMLSPIELQEFLRSNVIEIIEYYREFEEDILNEHERNTERNMAK